jgi:hypothetical protein
VGHRWCAHGELNLKNGPKLSKWSDFISSWYNFISPKWTDFISSWYNNNLFVYTTFF